MESPRTRSPDRLVEKREDREALPLPKAWSGARGGATVPDRCPSLDACLSCTHSGDPDEPWPVVPGHSPSSLPPAGPAPSAGSAGRWVCSMSNLLNACPGRGPNLGGRPWGPQPCPSALIRSQETALELLLKPPKGAD